jgi:Domain of unknown function (DUF222)
VKEALAAAVKALDECRAQAVFGLSLEELVSCVDDIHMVIQQATAVQLALVRQVDARQVAAAMGATSTLAWLRDRHRISHATASRLVKLARAVDVDAGSPTAEALAAGAVNIDQVQVITDAVAKLPVEHRAAGEEHLLGEAETFGPRELGRLGQRIFEVVAPQEAEKQALDELERAERRAWHDRGLWLTDIAGTSRVRVTGWLDQEGAASVRAALDPLCAPRTMRRTASRTAHADNGTGRDTGGGIGGGTGRDTGGGIGGGIGGDNDADPADVRSPAQRRVDALVEVCRLASACGDLPDTGGDRPQVVVTIDYDRLREQVGAATFDDGSCLSPAAARRIACDAGIIPAILGSTSQALDLGRQTRLVTGPLRRALVLRDRGCAFPGCDRPPRWTDAHHIQHWSNGGLTELPNLVLLCGYHHRLVHHSDWRVRISPKDGLPEFTPPAYVDAGRRPDVTSTTDANRRPRAALALAEDGHAVAGQVVEGWLASGHREQQRDRWAADLGACAVLPVGVGRPQREPGDPPLRADQQVAVLVEVGHCDDVLDRVVTVPVDGAEDVLAVDDRFAKP